MTAWLLAAAVAAAILPGAAFADPQCDIEARSLENQLRSSGTADLTANSRINRAQALCRDTPNAGFSELRSIQRELDQQTAARPAPLRSQPPPLGQPWTGAGPGAAVNRY